MNFFGSLVDEYGVFRRDPFFRLSESRFLSPPFISNLVRERSPSFFIFLVSFDSFMLAGTVRSFAVFPFSLALAFSRFEFLGTPFVCCDLKAPMKALRAVVYPVVWPLPPFCRRRRFSMLDGHFPLEGHL